VLADIQKCFIEDRVLYTAHARREMRGEEYGLIVEEEVYQAVVHGEIIEKYEDDQPYPSVLLFGRTLEGKPIHTVCAYSKEDDWVIVVTVYRPDPERWIDFKRRRK